MVARPYYRGTVLASWQGTFVLRAGPDPNRIMVVEIAPKALEEEELTRVESLEYLLDLRSKLLMTEVPSELDQEIGASALVEAFVLQLSVFNELGDALVALNAIGHPHYQSHSEPHGFILDGLPALQHRLLCLQVLYCQGYQKRGLLGVLTVCYYCASSLLFLFPMSLVG